MKQQKLHLKLNNKPICGVHSKRKLRYATTQAEVTCQNCKRAIAK